ncbi:MAG: hypothetical protein ACRDQ0_17840, partial [Pseudonocardia sp.]
VPDAPDGPRPQVRRFLAVAAGQLAAMAGAALAAFAIPIWVYLATGSLVQFALAAVLGLVPGPLVAPWVATVVDGGDRRTTLLAGDVGAGGVLLLLGLLQWTGNLQVWHVPLLALLSVALTFQRITHDSAVPQLVPKRFLAHLTGVVRLAPGATRLIVPVAGVGLLAVAGPAGVLALVVPLYAVAIAVTLLVRFPRTAAEPATTGITAGFRYVWGDPRRRRMLFFSAVFHVLVAPLVLLLPPLVLAAGTLADLGGVLLGAALAGVVGGLVLTVWGARHRVRGVLLCTLGLAAFGLVTGLQAIGVGVFGMALVLTLLGGLRTALVEVTVPQRFHGRVLALDAVVASAALPVGLVPAVAVAAAWGIGPLYVVFAVALALLAVGTGLSRLIDDSREDVSVAAARY